MGLWEDEPEFYPTSKGVALVRSMLPLPPELVNQIFYLAEYWGYSGSINDDWCRFYRGEHRFLRSKPIKGGDFAYPLRRVVVKMDSSDIIWEQDTIQRPEKSWTWAYLSIGNGETDDETARVGVVKNTDVGWNFSAYRVIIEDEEFLKQARKGDTLSVWIKAKSPAWHIHVRWVSIEYWVAC